MRRRPHGSRALKYEAKRLRRHLFKRASRAMSYWPLGEKEQAFGLTHLDSVLAREEPMLDGSGHLTHEFAAAFQRSRLFLIEQEVMGRSDMALSRDALDRLASRELQSTTYRSEKAQGRPVLT